MRLELTEILACPRCGPPQVLVAVVHAADGRYVRQGLLGCPACEARYAITDGVTWLAGPGAPEGLTGHEDASGSSLPDDTPLLLAALLGLESSRGPVVVGPELAGLVGRLAELVPAAELVELVTPGAAPGARPGTTPGTMLGTTDAGRSISRLVVPGGPLPFQSGRVQGIALAGLAGERLLAEAARLLAPGGRVVVVRPSAGARRAARQAGLEVLAADERALVAARPADGP